MEYQLERGLRLKTETQYAGLYEWAIVETDSDGEEVAGGDQIPWLWSLHFTATSCALLDSLNIQTHEEDLPEPKEISQRRVIFIELRPGRTEDAEFERPRYSMFGTARAVREFSLRILPSTDADAKETCIAWGTPAYEFEIDFRNRVQPDTIEFTLSVKPETFDRYAALIKAGAIDDIGFTVSQASGFYANWTPEISTRSVKVLSDQSAQPLSSAADSKIVPPRLGSVEEARLHLSRRMVFEVQAPSDREEDAGVDGNEVAAAPIIAPSPTQVELQLLKNSASLGRAAWLIVWLLVALLVSTVLRFNGR